MNIAIVTPEAVGPWRNGGIATYATQLAFLISQQTDHTVSIVYAGKVETPPSQWQAMYAEQNVRVILPPNKPDPLAALPGIGQDWFLVRSRMAAAMLPDAADVVILQENGATGFEIMRQHRLTDAHCQRAFISMMHGNRHWVLDAQQIPPDQGYRDLAMNLAERYTLAHSDFAYSNSQYLLNWVIEHGWELPAQHAALGLPFVPDPALMQQAPQPAPAFKRIVFFGRMETRKGIELFVDAAIRLTKYAEAEGLHLPPELVILGRDGQNRYGTGKQIAKRLAKYDWEVTVLNELDTFPAQQYLAKHAADSLVVMPSRVEALGYTIIETSLIPGLNMITTNTGGIPEVLGPDGADQLFAPTVEQLTLKLIETLQRGPQPDAKRGQYDWQQANQNWVDAVEQAAELAKARQQGKSTQAVAQPAPNDMAIFLQVEPHAPHLETTLTALLAQTYPDVTVYVIVNESASDAVQTWLKQQKAAHSNLRLLEFDAPMATSAAFNRAAVYSGAMFYAFVQQGYVMHPDGIAHMVAAANKADVHALTARTLFVPDDKVAGLAQQDAAAWVKVATGSHMPLGNVPELGLLANIFGQGAFIVQREVLERLGGFPPSWNSTPGTVQADFYAFLAKLSLAGTHLEVLPEVLLAGSDRFYHLDDPSQLYYEYWHVAQVYRGHLSTSKLSFAVPTIYTLQLAHHHKRNAQRNLKKLDPTDRHLTERALNRAQLVETDNSFRQREVFGYRNQLYDPQFIADRIQWSKLVKALVKKALLRARAPLKDTPDTPS